MYQSYGLQFRVWGLGFGVWGLGFGVWGLGLRVWGLGFGVEGYQRLHFNHQRKPCTQAKVSSLSVGWGFGCHWDFRVGVLGFA